MNLEKLNEASNVNTHAIRSANDEITNYRHQLQSQITQLEILKGSQQSLERQCMDLEDRHQAEVASYQVELLVCAFFSHGYTHFRMLFKCNKH